MLDVVNRADKAAFDAQVLHSGIPLDLEKAGNSLSAGSIGLLKDANILDIGCGLGDLTYGLTHSPAISNSAVYAFDHSVESLRQAAFAQIPANGNSVHFSAQDALKLFFADNFFDFAAGSAVLHHFHDYPAFLNELARVLKPGAKAIFSEPFFDGYLWPTLFLKNAIEEQGLTLNAPGLGSASVIVGLADFIARHRGADPELEHMTDKHFFRESEVSLAATTAGFRSVQFMNVAQPDFYTAWMPYFLDIYGVTHQKVRRSAITQYDRAAALASPLLPELMSHFKYIVLQKSC